MKFPAELTVTKDELRAVLESAIDTLNDEARGRLGFERRGGVIRVEPVWPMVFVGDLHGHWDAFREAFEAASEAGACERGLIIFLGDYVDRGPRQPEVLWAVLRLKEECPGRVILLRGNHEPPEGLEPYPHDFPHQLVIRYGDEGRALYALARKVFDMLPYAAIIEGYALAVHGGPPTARILARHPDPLGEGEDNPRDVITEVLWNDPSEYVDIVAPNPRGVGVEWGRRVTEAALETLGVEYIIRGHESAEGIRLNHGGRVVTVFTFYGPPYYNSTGGVLVCRNPSEPPEACATLIPKTRGLGSSSAGAARSP